MSKAIESMGRSELEAEVARLRALESTARDLVAHGLDVTGRLGAALSAPVPDVGAATWEPRIGERVTVPGGLGGVVTGILARRRTHLDALRRLRRQGVRVMHIEDLTVRDGTACPLTLRTRGAPFARHACTSFASMASAPTTVSGE
jgi:hypothetical protein